MEHPTNLMMVTALLIFDRPLDSKRFERVVADRLLSFARFRQRVVAQGAIVRRPRWELDPYFDLSAHLRRRALPTPGGREELAELVSSLLSTPLDYSKPLWQIHLIEGYGEGCAVLVRIHHAIADGVALMRVLLALTDERAAGWRLRPRRGDLRPAGAPAPRFLRHTRRGVGWATHLATRILREEARLVARPGRALELARLGGRAAAALRRLLLRPADPATALKGRLGVAKRAAWSAALELADVKAVGRLTGCTVNDVLMAAMTGALRRYLEECGEAVDDLSFHAAVPVNLRPAASSPGLGNRFGPVFVELPVAVADPLDRLFEVRRRMTAIKHGPEAGLALGLLGTVGATSAEIQKLLVQHIGARTTVVITNVAGPPRSVYLAGRRLRSLVFWVPQSGRVGVGISIMSYAGKVRVGVATDQGLVSEPERIVALFEREFARLMELVELAPLAKAS